MTAIYNSSSGPKLIAEMNPHNLRAAAAKLRREGDPSRADELVAMDIRLAEIELSPALQEELSAKPDRHSIGGNHPPEPITSPASGADPFEAISVHISDLYLEAKNWADGAEIENAAQASEVDRLIDAFKDAISIAETARDASIKPLTEQVTAIRERWYPLIADTTKLKGTAIRAKTALLAVKTKWGAKQRAIQSAEAERLRAEAFAKAREAVAATKAAPDDLEAAESAEDLIREAQAGLRQAKAVEAVKVTGYRTVWNVTITDQKLAIRSIWILHMEEMVAFALDLARKDAREGRRQIEGFSIEAERVAA